MKEIKQILKLLFYKHAKYGKYYVKLLVGNFEERSCYISEKQFFNLLDFFKENGFSSLEEVVWGAFEGKRFIWCSYNYELLCKWLKIKNEMPKIIHCHEKPKKIDIKQVEIIDELTDKTI